MFLRGGRAQAGRVVGGGRGALAVGRRGWLALVGLGRRGAVGAAVDFRLGGGDVEAFED